MISLCYSCSDITVADTAWFLRQTSVNIQMAAVLHLNMSCDVTECTRFCWGLQKKKMIQKARCQGKDCGRASHGSALAVFPDTSCHVHSELFPQRARKEEENKAWRSLFRSTTCPDKPLLTRTHFPKSRHVSHLKNVGGLFFLRIKEAEFPSDMPFAELKHREFGLVWN